MNITVTINCTFMGNGVDKKDKGYNCLTFTNSGWST